MSVFVLFARRGGSGHRFWGKVRSDYDSAADYFWMVPERSFGVDLGEFAQIVGFSFAGCSVSWLSGAARKRKRLEEHLRATLASVGEAIVTTDCEGRILYLNAMAEILTGLHGREAIGHTLSDARNLYAEDGKHWLNGTFQVAVNNDEIEDLPRRCCQQQNRQAAPRGTKNLASFGQWRTETGVCHSILPMRPRR